MGKAARIRAERHPSHPPVRKPTNARRTIPRRWLFSGIGAAAAAVAAVVIVSSLSGGATNAPAAAIDGSQTAALLQGIPQSGASLGSPSAPVVLYEFADLQCPYCQRFTTEVLPTVIRDYVRTGKVRIVFRGVSFLGPDSVKALRFALAAGQQNSLWDAADLLYLNQGQENSGWVTDELLNGIAAAVPGLDATKVRSAESSSAVTNEMTDSASQAALAGVDRTPTFLVSVHGQASQELSLSALTVSAFRHAIAPYVQ